MEEIKKLSKEIAIEDVIGAAVQIPMVKVERDKFLAEQFAGSVDNIQDIIDNGPVEYGISREILSSMANKLIIKRTSQSSIASFVSGIPGGLAMAATIPADIIQFFGMTLRLAQELSYLYGAEDLWVDGKIDDERIQSQLIMYCGVMFGVSGAVSGVRVLSTQIAETTSKKMARKPLMNKIWYRIAKKIGKAINVRVNKKLVSEATKKVIPIVGGVISGTLNFASMMPMAKRLYETFDKAIFDYNENEFDADVDIIERMSKGEDVGEDEPITFENIKEKGTETAKNVVNEVSGFVGKIGKRFEKSKEEDPLEKIKKLKELLDMGAITQEEFDAKKTELLEL